MTRGRLWPNVVQVAYGGEYKVYVYLNDGSIRLLDMQEAILNAVPIFAVLKDKREFERRLCVINDTVAFDMSEDGSHSGWDCYDCDPELLLYKSIVGDPLSRADKCETAAKFVLDYQKTQEQYYGEDHNTVKSVIMEYRKADGSTTKAVCFRRKPQCVDFSICAIPSGEVLEHKGYTDAELEVFSMETQKSAEWVY